MQTRFCLDGARSLFAAAASAVLVLSTTPAESRTGYLGRPEVQSFIEDLHAEHGLDPAEVERILSEARHQPKVVRLIGPERSERRRPIVRSYRAYRARFLTKTRIAAGVQYWETHEALLRQAEAEFGVPAEVILGILGVETAYGEITGSFRVVDALTTIAFDGPRRQAYFRDELKHFLLLAREIGLDPLAIKGSYAGAMGLPQFMPSSYRQYAVDYDGDGSTDLVDSPADAIGSVASYLKAYGWVTGEAPTVPVLLPADAAADLISGLERVHTVQDLLARGVLFPTNELPEGACTVIDLPTPGKSSKYLAGFTNFEVVTRYNRSTFYATAVLELADAIRSARQSLMAANKPQRSRPFVITAAR